MAGTSNARKRVHPSDAPPATGTATTPTPSNVTNARPNEILAAIPSIISCDDNQEFPESTDIHALLTQYKSDFYEETKKRVREFEKIVISDLNNAEAKRLCSFYKVRFKETEKMYSKSLMNTIKLQDDVRKLRERQDNQETTAETKELVTHIKEKVLKQRKMFKLFATHCFPCNAHLPNTNIETLTKHNITSETGLGQQIFKLITQDYKESRKTVPGYLQEEKNRRHLWFECQLGKLTLATFNAMRNQYRNRIRTEFNKILDEKINNEPNDSRKKELKKELLLQTFDDSMVEIDASTVTPHDYGDLLLDLFFQMALYRDDSDKENNRSQRRSAKKVDLRKANISGKTIFSSIKPNLLAMVLLTVRQRIVVLLIEWLKDNPDEKASVADLLLDHLHMLDPGNIHKGRYSELISHHQSDGIAECEVKLFYKLRDAIKAQEKFVKNNPDQVAYMFGSDGAQISMDEPLEQDKGCDFAQMQDANLNWEDSDADGHSAKSFVINPFDRD